jgi:NAD(P)-dependent dehydrogenase (short-subunit alcohol dehydrogenase family)
MASTMRETFRLDGRVALVTGAATGLGAGIAVMLARQGADVAISDRPGVALNETAEQLQTYGHRVFRLQWTCAMEHS